MLDTKSTELEETSSQLHRANTQLKAFDYLKDEFFQLSHMNSTPPLTSIKAFSEILHQDNGTTIE